MEHPSPEQQAEAAQVYLTHQHQQQQQHQLQQQQLQQQQHQQLVAPVAAAPQPVAAELPAVPDSPIQVTDPTKTSSSAFILGIHNYKALNDVDLPEFVKEHQATLTFPEKLMLLLTYVDKEYGGEDGKGVEQSPISWILDGRAFVIRSREELVKHLLPMFFRQAKFASFTRKLYRWGFRQVSMSTDKMGATKREMIFGHECFQRDNKPLMSRMRSVTAAGTRRAIAANHLKQQKIQQQTADKISLEPKYALAPATVPGAPAQTFIFTQPPAIDGKSQPPAFMVLPPGVTLAQPAQVQQAMAGVPAPQHTISEHHAGVPTMIQHHHHPQQTVMQVPQSMNVTLQNALLVAHQQGGTPMAAPVAAIDPNAVTVQTAAPAPVAEPQQGEAPEAPAAVAAATVPNGYLASLAQLGINASDPAQAAQQLQAMQNASGGDANAYMRAAIDMLLRSASNAAK
eukprot:CAMPEP_0194055778 /NCGR_PEP_ID=MMETSP0009_2-20130614/57881_1 /TAXON_ID=210454 /ORGANISM="Grammatophora oceanica, Strain CCMP 410" /LENGTH=454 /DNA_ID=CAMNT_0038704829 /DNA_START=207 /DNA_END=1571 /DNA_ORIENTATION=+